MNKLIGVIGGTGLDNPDLFLPEAESFPETPFGKPSSPLRTGVIKGSDTRIVLLARHGLDHTIPPHRVNYRANVYALRKAGCTQILASACCGSLQDQFGPGSLVVPDQFIDFTRQR
ncbi:MAG: MTAP family purine nucleoside phosphorylase, partial [Desulfovibrio sp.]|nr:MTAP family purine nucleoside phosphorylase [Desulfovibrio sp.]